MTAGRHKWKIKGTLLVLAVLIVVSLFASGCVSGLAPVGWSGGVVDGNKLYIGSTEGRLVVISLTDESRQWAEPMREGSQGIGCSLFPGTGGCASAAGVAIYGTPVIYNGLVYAAGYNGKIYAYNSDTLAVRWVFPREGYLKPFVGGIAADGSSIYVGSTDGIVYALDAETGDLLWNFEAEKEIWATPAVNGDTVYIGSFDEKLYAINAADGSKKWEFTTEGAIVATPLIHDGTIYFGSMDKNMYAVDITSGNQKWQFTGENWFWAMPVINEGRIYAGCMDDRLYVLDAANGKKINEIDLGSPVPSTPVIVGDKLIVASKEGIVFSVNTYSGSLTTLLELEDLEIHGPLTGYENIVYIHTQDKKLHRINVDNGAVLRDIDLAMP